MKFKKDDIQKLVNTGLTGEKKQLIAKVVGILLALFIFSKFVGCVRTMMVAKPKKEKVVKITNDLKQNKGAQSKQSAGAGKNTNKEKTPVSNKNVVKPAALAANPAAESVSKPEVQQDRSVTLTVRAQEDSWLRVKADGNVVFQSTLKKGVPETWTAKETVELSGKNINQLEFELNGKMIGVLGRNDRGARQLIVTKDGLSVKK
jgi:cytoskeletal protein RodZ